MRSGSAERVRWGRVLLALLAVAAMWLAANSLAVASGPRWVTGPPYFTSSGQPVVWYTASPAYYTDPGDLSSFVDHAAADALVAAAAGVWNVPTSTFAISQGGQLAEHVSGQDVYSGTNGLVFPADVSSANYLAIPIAVIYDSDGSITDLILGQGASDPEECLQNGVTESVDSISPAGLIQHALLILNGRCTGQGAEQQLQLQYQLMRAFGRVIGLSWSQVNDNVFTASPVATSEEINKWPIMHPIDIVCGPYTYQCLPNPFTLRPDDVASISQLYFIPKGAAPPGKMDSLSNASAITGVLRFGDNQGMQGVNVVVRRHFPASTFADIGPVVSAVTGTLFRWNNGNPVTGASAATVAGSAGTLNPAYEGEFSLGMIPELPGTSLQDAYMTTEAINPLYIGQYGIGPYQDAPVTPSGPAFTWRDNGVVPYESNYYDLTVPGSAGACDASELGTPIVPASFPASGWETASLCSYGVSAWFSIVVRANRSLTVEATALDEQGLVTENKLQPLIGVWNLADPTGTLPTVAASQAPFNSIAAGLTSLTFDAPQAGRLRMVIADERGDGRPDFNYRARVLYADSVSPAMVSVAGGLVTITGMGFRPGDTVTIGGVPATVVTSTATTILVIAPPFASLGAGASQSADVVVNDLMSGGSTAMYGALTYPSTSVSTSPAVTMLTPKFFVAAGQIVPLLPQVVVSNGGAVAANVPVLWSDVSGVLSFANGARSTSDANGLASVAATASSLAPGTAALGSACAQIGGTPVVCSSFTATGVGPSLWTPIALEGAAQVVASTSVLQPVVFQVVDDAGDPVIGAPVTVYQTVSGWEACPIVGRCPIAPIYQTSQNASVSDANGLVVVAPQQIYGAPEQTAIAVATGTLGFASVVLQKTP